MDLERALTSLVDAGIEFVMIGGVAMYAHGSSRLTRDLDICYGRSAENLERLALALGGFHPRLRDAPASTGFRLDARALRQGMNFTLVTDLGDLDLIGEVPGIGGYAEVKGLSVSMPLFGRSCEVLSLDGLIRAKRASARPRDLDALKELEALREVEDQQ
ncbi:MAG: hypothetical protein KGM47_01890 [Acidobacteriota bacterium]|nr:hypothetical protein [Acidobacteriota bacterium]